MAILQRVLSSILLAFLLSGCAGEAEKTESLVPATKLELQSNSEIKQQALKMITLRGTVKYKNLEGGFWGLDGDDGKKYMPSGLSKALLVDGLVIEVTGTIEEDVMTFQQYGKTLKIIKSRIIDDSNAKALNSY